MAIEFMGETYEEHHCPHCGEMLTPTLGAPGSGWNVILVCQNNDCEFFKGSPDDIQGKRASNVGCRYAVNPDNGYKPFNLLAWRAPV
ncbi:MAG: hypothetical protein PWQ57_1286 [Desulfovibrionales bacterium]|jgi:hypothetical protein|nr:hypothetical protein [Desulfovibrionales bacterium]